MEYFCKNTKIGDITVVQDGNFIVGISFGKNAIEAEFKLTSLIEKTFGEIEEYFEGKRKEFDIPCKLKGTSFQKKVWMELNKIPYGKTFCYKDIAQKINKPNASRAVGLANNKNPIVIITPCHRVIGKNGKLTGYRGGLKIKEFLLELEKNNI